MNEIYISTEDLSKSETGGGYRHTVTHITIDNTLPLDMQKRAVAYEVLGAYLDTAISHEILEDIATAICDAQEQLG